VGAGCLAAGKTGCRAVTSIAAGAPTLCRCRIQRASKREPDARSPGSQVIQSENWFTWDSSCFFRWPRCPGPGRERRIVVAGYGTRGRLAAQGPA